MTARFASMSTNISTSKKSCLRLKEDFSSYEARKESTNLEKSDLPPVDGGCQAWMFLAASTMIEALVWGFAFAFGVFEDYYRDSELLKDSNIIAVIGTCATVRPYLIIPFGEFSDR